LEVHHRLDELKLRSIDAHVLELQAFRQGFFIFASLRELLFLLKVLFEEIYTNFQIRVTVLLLEQDVVCLGMPVNIASESLFLNLAQLLANF